MATEIWAVGPNSNLENVQVNVGPTATSAITALVVNLATNVVNDNGTTRGVKKEEVLQSIELIKESIVRGNWPPA